MATSYHNVYTNKTCLVDTHQHINQLNLENAANKKIIDAYGHEVNVFMHCHMRGYDKTGCGLEMVGHYYDKYGAPLTAKSSWQEGYRAIEEELAKHFRICSNKYMNMPLIAGYGGGVHLYKPIKMHDDKPWNMTGWIPLESKWCCENKYFRNRHFFALRGNEIQNDLWDYHPYASKDCIEEKGNKFSQFVPLDEYEGGYWYYKNVNGRYLHLITLKDHAQDETGVSQRYNYIVHPLAYRRNMKLLPDNSVDGMQWSITNINTEEHFQEPNKLRKWGERCHGLEIFNDFTYYYSWQPENLDDNPNVHTYGEIFNGTKMNYQKKQKYQYHYWFNSYPLEFGEFLLDSALSCGTYLHPVSANDGFYNRHVVPQNKGVNLLKSSTPGGEDDAEESDEETEGMERVLMADPKGTLVRASRYAIQASDIGCNRRSNELNQKLIEAKNNNNKSEVVLLNEIIKFNSEMPYHFNTVFGYTALLDPNKEMHTMIKNNKPPNVVDDAEDLNTGLNDIETNVVQKLQHGQFYAHTGVYDIFNYGEYEDMIPYKIHNQPTSDKLCPEIFPDLDMNLVFSFAKAKEEKKNLIWRYTIQVRDNDDDATAVTTTQGFFKLDTSMKTVLDLDRDYRRHSVCWLRFSVFDPENPQRRAWYPPVRGPAFSPFEQLHKEPVKDIDAIIPAETIRIASLQRVTEKDEVHYVQKRDFFQPYELTCPQLEICMDKCSKGEEHFIYSYFMQVYPTKQTIDLSEGSGTSKSESVPNNPEEPIIPRIRNSVHGYFQLCDEQPTQIMLRESWDAKTLVDGKVYVYGISNIDGQPLDVKDLMLPAGLPAIMLLPPDQMV